MDWFKLVDKEIDVVTRTQDTYIHTHTYIHQVDWFKLVDKEIDVVTRTTNAEIARVRSELSRLRDACEQWSKEMKDKSAEQTGMRARSMLARMGVLEAKVGMYCMCVCDVLYVYEQTGMRARSMLARMGVLEAKVGM